MTLDFAWDHGVTVDGDATDTAPADLVLAIEAVALHVHPLTLRLYGLDLDTGAATVAWHQTVRLLRERHGHVVLHEAPQMLAHSLYKVGDLSDGRIELVDPRVDEGTTAN